MNLYHGLEDQKEERSRIVERREWHHSNEGGTGFDCPRKTKPVIVAPGKLPDACRGVIPTPFGRVPCGNENWRAGDIVFRKADTKEIVRRVDPNATK